MSDIEARRDALAALALPDGGWGYLPGQSLALEPTCLALLALQPQRDRYAEVHERGLRAIEQHLGPDGGYRALGGREESTWPTALVLFLQAALGLGADPIQRTASRLLSIQGRTLDRNESATVQDIDTSIVGWPWAEGNFSWVEPTSWACLALRRAGYGKHPRVIEGQRLLCDRLFPTGGVNYGNRMVFTASTEPSPGPTSLMLLALQGSVDLNTLRPSIHYLARHAAGANDPTHIAWAALALDCHAAEPEAAAVLPQLAERLRLAEKSHDQFGCFRSGALAQALACLALALDQGNPFRLSQPDSETIPPVVKLPERPKQPWSRRFKSMVDDLAVKALNGLRPVPVKSTVHIARAADYDADLANVLKRQYEVFREKVPLAGKSVVLKPNLVEYRKDRVINTHPRVIAAAIELCRAEGAREVIVAEGPGHWRNVEYLVAESGLGDVLRQYQVRFVDLNHDEPVKIPNLGRSTGLEHLHVAKTVATAEVLISLPKMKTHHWAGATLSLKNLFGTLPGAYYGWPKNELHWRGIDNSIIDIALTRTPDLAIVDGIVGMEGDGPLAGSAREVGALVMGNDLMAVDATCCRIMQLAPEGIGYLKLGALKRLGLMDEARIEQAGEAIASVSQPFEVLPIFNHLRKAQTA